MPLLLDQFIPPRGWYAVDTTDWDDPIDPCGPYAELDDLIADLGLEADYVLYDNITDFRLAMRASGINIIWIKGAHND